jgi:GWxTD domain-containing protein
MMKVNRFLHFVLLILLLVSSVHSEEVKSFPLSPTDKKWLDEVYWIISDYEKNAFQSLTTEADRNRFMEAFWEDRDPTPGTKKNEFKEAHYQRFEYATKHFGRDTTLPGWKTDRGRIYIQLGKPQFTKSAPAAFEFQPMELWHYVGLREYGLPGSLYLLFFQEKGMGTYRLYSPLSDGIQALYNARKFEMNKAQDDLYDYMSQNLDPEFAHAALNPIPTEGGVIGTEGMTATVSTEVILGKVQNARNYQADKRKYVEAVLEGRPTVKVYYSIGSEGIHDGIYWFQAPTGNFYLDYAMEYEPRKLDMGQYEDEYYTSLSVDGQIAVDPKTVVDEIVSTHEVKLSKEQIKKVGSMPFQYQGMKPIVPGKFGVSIIITNNLSRQAATFTHDVEIPNMATYGKPYLTPILPVRSVEKVNSDSDSKLRPFQFGDKIYIPNIPAKFSQSGSLQLYHQVIFNEDFHPIGTLALRYLIYSGDKQEVENSDPITLSAADLPGNSIEIKKDIPLSNVSLGQKKLIVQLTEEGKVVSDSPPMNFSVESQVEPGVWKLSVALPNLDSEYHSRTLAQQFMRMKENKQALSLLEQSLQRNPESVPIRLELMRAAMQAKEYSKVITIGGPAEVKNPNSKDLLWLMGWASYGLEKYDDVVRFFERLRFLDPKKVEVLNVLADVYYRKNDPQKSLERIQESLALKSDQKDIQDLRKKIESQKNQ